MQRGGASLSVAPARAHGMPRGTRRLLAALVGLLLAAGTHAGDDAQQKQAELQQLRHKIEVMQNALQADRHKKSRAERQLQAVEEQVGRTRQAMARSTRELRAIGSQINALKAQRRRAASGLGRQSGALGREVRAAYIMGRQQRVKLLLNQQRPAEVGRMLVYFSYVSRARQATMADIHRAMQALDALSAEIELKQQAQLDLHKTEQQQAERLLAQQQQRRDVVARLQLRLSRRGDELKGLRQDEQHLQALLESLQELLSDIPAETARDKPFKARKGQLHWPAQGRLERRFGTLRGSSGLKWQGVFIAAPEGGQVRAVSQGRVAFADWMRGFGLLLIIDHGDGYMTLYGHNQALYKEVGEWVDSGEVVATLGASGGHTAAGLYFEIRHNGQPVNPLGWCAGKPAAVSG